MARGLSAADAGQRRRASGQSLSADRPSAHVAPAVRARIELAHRGLYGRQMVPRLFEQCRDVLAFERDRRALGIVLIVAA